MYHTRLFQQPEIEVCVFEWKYFVFSLSTSQSYFYSHSRRTPASLDKPELIKAKPQPERITPTPMMASQDRNGECMLLESELSLCSSSQLPPGRLLRLNNTSN
jgi:hypothetical protein